jgi:hypothetical protein
MEGSESGFEQGTLSKIVILLDRVRRLKERREIMSDHAELEDRAMSSCDEGGAKEAAVL